MRLKLYEDAICAMSQKKKNGRKDALKRLATPATDAYAEAEPEEPPGRGLDSMSDAMSQKILSDAGSQRSSRLGRSRKPSAAREPWYQEKP